MRIKVLSTILLSFSLAACSGSNLVRSYDMDLKVSPVQAEQQLMAAETAPLAFPQMDYESIELNSTQLYQIDQSRPAHQFDDGRSFYLALALPETGANATFEAFSFANDVMLMPKVVFLDAAFQPVGQIKAKDWHYQPPGSMSRDGLLNESLIDTRVARYALIYTPDEYRGEVTRRVSLEEVFNESQGIVTPQFDPKLAYHSAMGLLQIRISGEQALVTVNESITEPAPTQMPEAAGLLPATEASYQAQIRQALDAGEIDQALDLLIEAESRGSESARLVIKEALTN